ncbi:ComEA family DNA-binding protein [Bradymonas sediminis]|nr:helix-hairpin-helix domain-containing protein [Bradymonas sediminis]TDP73910.1 helix-hairpin-helix protein [Bradymonas sediminis]
MRIEWILCCAVIWGLGLVACSQPEPVIASYEAVNCPCEEDAGGVGQVKKVEAPKTSAPPAARALRLVEEVKEQVRPAPVEVAPKTPVMTSEKAAKPPLKLTTTRAECEQLLSWAEGKSQGFKGPKTKRKAKPKSRASAKPEVKADTAAKSAPAPSPVPSPAPAVNPALLDLNTATHAQLLGLPGVGPALAGRILDYRQKRRFGKPAHLMRVKGIGKAKYAKIAKFVGVGED